MVFLFIPTLVVVIGAFAGDGILTHGNLRTLADAYVVGPFARNLLLSAVSAAVGAVLGACSRTRDDRGVGWPVTPERNRGVRRAGAVQRRDPGFSNS